MVIDFSALMVTLLDEQEAGQFLDHLSRDEPKHISTATLLEDRILSLRILSEEGLRGLSVLLRLGRIDPIHLAPDHVECVLKWWRRHGRGPHGAGLNFGDCFRDVLTKAMGQPLLHNDASFHHTDVLSGAAHR